MRPSSSPSSIDGSKVWLDDLGLGKGAFRQQTLIDQAILLHRKAMIGANVNRVARMVDNEHAYSLAWGTLTPTLSRWERELCKRCAYNKSYSR